MKIKQKIHNNKIINILYKCHFYFTLGKGQIAKVTDMFTEISAGIIILTLVGGIDLTQYKTFLGIALLVFIIGLTILGWFFKNSGLWDVEVKVNATKNIVEYEIYTAALRINKKYKKIKYK